MKYLIVFVLCSSFAFGSVRPMDRVHAYAGNHKVTVRLHHGVYWVEMEDSDIFGVGTTLDEAAEDFMADADLETNESGKPYPTPHGQQQTPIVCSRTSYCI